MMGSCAKPLALTGLTPTKRCRICGLVRPIDRFAHKPDAADRRSSECLDCRNARARERKAVRRIFNTGAARMPPLPPVCPRCQRMFVMQTDGNGQALEECGCGQQLVARRRN